MDFRYDVIVIGAGHAGCEAAAASANLGSKTCLITMDMNKIGQMSCNPAIGGIAKGQIVREIDALGGQMGLITDKTAIQFRILNRSKGPAMWSPRAQCDRNKFIGAWREVLENTPNLHIWQDTVKELLVENGEVTGLITMWGVTFHAKCIVLTAGTFLNGLMHVGKNMLPGGRMAEPASYELTESIARHGISYGRMKTGTPVRIDGRSVHYELMDTQDGEADFHKFSFMDTNVRHLKQLQCWTCFTNPEVHSILREGLSESPLFNGQIQSIGPRYCPSIETKIVTFPDKEQHQLFLEPEGETTQELYLNGFSSSLPMNIQIEALKKVPAFKDLVIYRPGYAIEYDFFDPTQLKHTLESKIIKNLKTGTGSSYFILASNYQYKSKKGNLVKPSQKMLASWIQSVSVLRNMCAHNSRIYNRTIHTTPEILDVDKVVPSPAHNGLYQILLAMKYLRSSDEEWVTFVAAFDKLIQNNIDVVSLTAMNLPADWKAHLSV